MTPPKSCNQNASGKGERIDVGFRERGAGLSGNNKGHVRKGRFERSTRLTSGHPGGGFGQDNRLRFGDDNKGTKRIIKKPDGFSNLRLIDWKHVCLPSFPDSCKKWNLKEQPQK